MCFLSGRDRRQLKANLWRTKTVLSRDPSRVRVALIQPIVLFAILIILKLVAFKSTTISVTPLKDNDWTVVSSETNGTNTWPDDPTLYSNFSLTNCTENS